MAQDHIPVGRILALAQPSLIDMRTDADAATSAASGGVYTSIELFQEGQFSIWKARVGKSEGQNVRETKSIKLGKRKRAKDDEGEKKDDKKKKKKQKQKQDTKSKSCKKSTESQQKKKQKEKD